MGNKAWKRGWILHRAGYSSELSQLWGLSDQQPHVFCYPALVWAVTGGCAEPLIRWEEAGWEISPGSPCAGGAVVSAVTSLLCARISFSSSPELSGMVQSKKKTTQNPPLGCEMWGEMGLSAHELVLSNLSSVLTFKQFLVLFKPPPFPPKEMKCRSFQIFMTLNDQSWEEIFL